MGDWISVSDRLPEESDNIPKEWRPNSDGVHVIAAWADDDPEVYHAEFRDGIWLDEYDGLVETPTHWMPYPKPPTRQ